MHRVVGAVRHIGPPPPPPPPPPTERAVAPSGMLSTSPSVTSGDEETGMHEQRDGPVAAAVAEAVAAAALLELIPTS